MDLQILCDFSLSEESPNEEEEEEEEEERSSLKMWGDPPPNEMSQLRLARVGAG